jgi:hypothetical protein
MNTSNFLKQIRYIIREEIEYALNEKLNESHKRDDRKVISHGVNLVNSVGKTIKKAPNKKTKTGLTSIQSLLDETRRSMEASMAVDEGYGSTLSFTTDSLNSVNNHYVDATPHGVDADELAPEVSKAFTRDYSALMAKIEEKKGR